MPTHLASLLDMWAPSAMAPSPSCNSLEDPLSTHPLHPPPCAESYQGLSRGQVALVAQEACRSHTHMVAQIRKMADEQPLPEPLY